MTNRNEFHSLKTIAKRLARARRIPHYEALNSLARELGYPHWNALAVAWHKGWRPTVNQMSLLEQPQPVGSVPRGIEISEESEGSIAGQKYELSIGFDDVLIGGKGWAIHLGHAPSEPATIETYVTPNPLDDAVFLSEVMKVANAAADKVRQAIARDWPRRSTKPDRDGGAMHPLFGDISAEWHCLHCDSQATGAQMANNMWHCPKCGATPIDIHPQPWWKGGKR